ncbi:MAG: hypothetical protein HZC01_05570 [Candidatus Kerfeldbacteria bacterium]|nr:hypothetical protein [Candidatus Kerfeldbacteria bacterium]
MPGLLLITRPEYEDTTRYLSCWSDFILNESKGKGFERIDLSKKKANKERFLGILRKKSGIRMLVVLNGHGDDRAVAGQDNEIIMSVEDAALLSDKIIYARACSSAKELGPSAVSSGALAYIGYDIEFVFFTENDKLSRPLQDRTAALFLEPSNHVPIALLKGHPASDVNYRSQEKSLHVIKRLVAEGPKSVHYYTIPFLFANMNHQVCSGGPKARL